jgi:hypothetical protein
METVKGQDGPAFDRRWLKDHTVRKPNDASVISANIAWTSIASCEMSS